MIETTSDGFLGGRLTVCQPRTGYRAGADPVFLAAAVPAEAGQSVLDLGCGVGVAILCLLARVPGLRATGVEIQMELANLARANVMTNGLAADIVAADLAKLPASIRSQSFDHVLTNPPYFDRAQGDKAEAPGRETGRGETLTLRKWIDIAIRRLTPGGHLTVIQRASRLPELLSACDDRVGDIRVQPLAARSGRSAELVILTTRKGARGDFRLCAPVILHSGERHEEDRDSSSPVARAVLREGKSLEIAKLIHT